MKVLILLVFCVSCGTTLTKGGKHVAFLGNYKDKSKKEMIHLYMKNCEQWPLIQIAISEDKKPVSVPIKEQIILLRNAAAKRRLGVVYNYVEKDTELLPDGVLKGYGFRCLGKEGRLREYYRRNGWYYPKN